MSDPPISDSGKPGVSLRYAYRPDALVALDALTTQHPCAACGKRNNYLVGDQGPRRTLGVIVYYRAAIKCRCGFMNFVNVIVNDLPDERRKGALSSDEALLQAAESGILEDPVVEELLQQAAVAGFHEEWDRAMELIGQCVERAPNHPAAWYNLGVVYTSRGDHEEGMKAYKRVTELSDDFPSAWLNMGLIYQHTNAWQKAVACFDRVLERYPNQAAAIKGRKECLEHLNGQGGASKERKNGS